MPYGIENETPKQTKWMEDCVESVMSKNKGYDKSKAIAICKAQLKKSDWDPDAQSELSMREELWQLEDKIREAIGGGNNTMVEPAYSPYVADVFDDYVIIEKGPKLYKVDWSLSGGDVTIMWDTAVEVERKTVYEPTGESEMKYTQVPVIRSKKNTRVITFGGRTVN